MPGEGFAHGPPATKNAGGRYHRFSRTSGIPRAMGYGLYVLCLVRRASWPPSPRSSSAPRNLISASGYQHHTTSPSTSGPARPAKPSASTASPPHVRDDAYVPLIEAGCVNIDITSEKKKEKNSGVAQYGTHPLEASREIGFPALPIFAGKRLLSDRHRPALARF